MHLAVMVFESRGELKFGDAFGNSANFDMWLQRHHPVSTVTVDSRVR